MTDPCYQESFGGNSFGHCCHFPFIHQGQIHYSCIHDNDEDETSKKSGNTGRSSWCSTTHDYDQDQKWGYCEENISAESAETNENDELVQTKDNVN